MVNCSYNRVIYIINVITILLNKNYPINMTRYTYYRKYIFVKAYIPGIHGTLSIKL